VDRQPAFNLPPVVVWLALAFMGVHAARQFLRAETDWWVLVAFGFSPARYHIDSAQLPGGVAADFWTPVTHAFLHADILHLIVNLVWMASFGSALARRFGTGRFLLLSAASAAAGAGLNYALYPGEETLLVGASGAISGMMAGTARFAFAPGGPLSPHRGTAGSYSVPAEPLTALVTNRQTLFFILIWFAVNLLFGFVGDFVPGASGPIAWEAHVGGFLAGLVAFSLLDPVGREPPRKANGLAS
jgi:membrane associated rhomboid family serine protease